MRAWTPSRRDRRRAWARWLAAAGAAAALALPALPAAQASSAGRPAAASAGTLLAWGNNVDGELGNGVTGGTSDTPVPVSLPPGTTVTQVRAGCAHTLALTSTGQVLAWGNNFVGQLGNGTKTDSNTPVPVSLPVGVTVKAVRAGCEHSLALTSTGQVLAWGHNGNGQLGDGSTQDSSVPIPVALPPGTTVKAISAGSFHSLAVTSTGQVLAWGDNRNGELGDGTTTSSDTPVFVHMPVGVAAVGVAGGNSDSLALTSTGRVLAWGFNGLGELGDGTTTERHHPVAVKLATGTKVRGVFCGEFHVIALTSTGKVLGWGSNQFGSLGDGTSTDRHRPVAVKLPAGTTVTGVSAGFAHSLAVTSGGKVFAWGFNGSGELGNGTHLISDLPVKAKLPAGLVATAVGSGAGAQWSLAIVHPAAP